MNEIVSDHSESDPAPDAVRSFIERSSQSVAAFENTDPTFTARAPFLKLLEPTLLLPLLAGCTLGVMARNRYSPDPHRLGLGFISGRKESGIRRHALGSASKLFDMLLQTS